MRVQRGLYVLARVVCVAALAVLVGATATAGLTGEARAAGYESLMVPSAAMGRDIPVAFLGRRAARGLSAGPLRRRRRRQQLGHRGQRDEHHGRQRHLGGGPGRRRLQHVHRLGTGRQQAVGNLPVQRAAGLAGRQQGPGARAGMPLWVPLRAARRSGVGRVSPRPVLASPARFGFPVSVKHKLQRRDPGRHAAVRRRGRQRMWGPPQLGRWKWHDPMVHAALLAQNNTRVWVYSPTTMVPAIPPP